MGYQFLLLGLAQNSEHCSRMNAPLPACIVRARRPSCFHTHLVGIDTHTQYGLEAGVAVCLVVLETRMYAYGGHEPICLPRPYAVRGERR